MTADERKAFGRGWDAACTGGHVVAVDFGRTPVADPYEPGSRLAACYAQGLNEASEGYSDGPARVGDWKDEPGDDDTPTFCMQCGDPTTKKEGALCTLCAQQDADANAEHEADHGPGRV